MSKRFLLRHTIPSALVAACTITALCLGLFAYMSAAERLRLAAQDRLDGLAQTRAAAVDTWLEGLVGDLVLTANSRSLRDAVIALNNGWRVEAGNGDASTRLRQRYVDTNPYGPSERHKLEKPNSDNLYDMPHQRIQAWLDDLRQRRGLADILLISAKGQVLYSVTKDFDFARPLTAGPVADLAAATFASTGAAQAGAVDFSAYGQGKAGFLMAPVRLNPTMAPLAVLAFRLPADALDSIAGSERGLGLTGDAFVVGADKALRSKPRFDPAKTDKRMWAEADAGKALGLHWRLVSSAAVTEVLAPVDAMRNRMVLAGIALLTVISAIGVWFARTITGPLAAMNDAMQRLAQGERQLRIPATERGDEIGGMAQAMAVFKDALGQADTLRHLQDQENHNRERRALALEHATRTFESQVGAIVDAVTEASGQLQDAARTMSADAERTRAQAADGSDQASRTASNVNTVAAAATQLSASIDEIDRRMRDTGHVTETALGHAAQAGDTMHRVVESSQQIEEVLRLITTIATQTNLLALNATIEAARAGDAGKGFAVVAEEVKHLAHKTAQATDDIASQIAAMRLVTDGAAEAMTGIIGVVANMGKLSEEMAVSIEEQGNATREIAQGAERAAHATQSVTAIICAVGEAALSTHDTAQTVLQSSQSLARQAEHLKNQIQHFLGQVAMA